MPDLQILHRNRFRPLTGATARRIAGNCWEVTIPFRENSRWIPGKQARDFDDSVMLIDDDESIQVMGTREHPDAVTVTVVLL